MGFRIGTKQPLFHIVLFRPEIPGNTGSIGRTCLALGLRLHLIRPLGFSLDEKAVRRAGLDYWKFVDLCEHDSWPSFLQKENPAQLIFFSRFAQERPYFKAPYSQDCYLVFGRETSGLPQEIILQNQCYALPLFDNRIRSLNLSNTVTVAAYEALRQIRFSES